MKERILEKAQELFTKFGIRVITMDEIAWQLGISKKTIYRSFADKEAIVLEVFNYIIEETKSRCVAEAKAAKDAVHEVYLGLDSCFEILKAMNPNVLYELEKFHPKVFEKFISFKNDFLLKIIADNLNRGIDEGLYRPDIDVTLLSHFRIGTIMISANSSIFPTNRFGMVEIEHQIGWHFAYGVATSKGIRAINRYKNKLKKKY